MSKEELKSIRKERESLSQWYLNNIKMRMDEIDNQKDFIMKKVG
ncbi:MAG: hypothetical protein ACOC2W_02050 [bacterium]